MVHPLFESGEDWTASHLGVLTSVTIQEAPLTSESLCGSAPMQSLLQQTKAAQAARSTLHHLLVSAQSLHCKFSRA